jgi:hypothetical protein
MNKYLLIAAALVLARASAEARELTMLEDRFDLPVFQTGPSDKSLWWTWRILRENKTVGERLFLGKDGERCRNLAHTALGLTDKHTQHVWCVANMPPLCAKLSDLNLDAEIKAEVRRINEGIVAGSP